MRTARERREYVIAHATTAAVKIALTIALAVAAVQAFRAIQIHASGVSVATRLVLPLALLAGAAFALRGGLKSLAEARETHATPLEPDDDDLD